MVPCGTLVFIGEKKIGWHFERNLDISLLAASGRKECATISRRGSYTVGEIAVYWSVNRIGKPLLQVGKPEPLRVLQRPVCSAGRIQDVGTGDPYLPGDIQWQHRGSLVGLLCGSRHYLC